ncbi:uncharacterized protein SPPG_07130 [Spizellomyces punctatus DAOM BR117]|uniref:Uncharacterized protein n=1 Tax=Spizellomyces punctatus (strain DAOM BR117) TaxID=645134 RepID=A0A0L0HAE9_SPIPD|nr:uncharacterized protein SPPG_07130 [Spizellomyces punctatus DAOM BR117]KNC97663.1 hypothetical protein SPPG_07130 [Spizellomyces punctatus DAOM BR117]|eukprot:XP_016605703.1 hypothetical protein SPPG_07130 [Spizellomyces punctatus DAOM BR117]
MPEYAPLFATNKQGGRKPILIGMALVALVVFITLVSTGSIPTPKASGRETQEVRVPESGDMKKPVDLPKVVDPPVMSAVPAHPHPEDEKGEKLKSPAKPGTGNEALLAPHPKQRPEGSAHLEEQKPPKGNSNGESTKQHHHGAGQEHEDDEEEDHEMMHGEPGVANPVSGIFGEVDRFADHVALQAEWSSVLANVHFEVDAKSHPPVFIAKHETQKSSHAVQDDLFASEKSIQAVLTRALSDALEMNDPALYVDVGCSRSPLGHAYSVMLAGVRGASSIHCLLSPSEYQGVSPIIAMSARLNLVDDKLWVHASNILDPKENVTSFDDLALPPGPIAVLRIPALEISKLTTLLTSSPRTLETRLTRHIIVDLPTTEPMSQDELIKFLEAMHTAGYDLHFLPSTSTYTHVAVASFLGSEYSAKHLDTEFIYVPKQDFDLVKRVLEDGGVGGAVRVWWVRREDETVKKLMKTRHHHH